MGKVDPDDGANTRVFSYNSDGLNVRIVAAGGAMVAKVTNEGLLIPKALLGSTEQVQIVEEPGRIVLILDPQDDPIWNLGKNPITLDVDDASVNHDKYIYGQ